MSSKRPCISISLLDDDEPIVFTPKSIVFPVIDLSRLARPKHSAEMKNLEAMAYRELGPEDYALLSQLDEAVEKPKHALNLARFPLAVLDRSQPDCAVCLDRFSLGEMAMRTDCGHLFHAACLAPWGEISEECPVCKFPMCT